MLTSIALLLALQPPPPSPPCNRDATVWNQISPDYPDSARRLNIAEATVVIRILVTPQGRAGSTQLLESSGNSALDHAALLAASQSTYLPKMKNCRAVAGSYIFKVTFTANSS